jgi:hypothetical protein
MHRRLSQIKNAESFVDMEFIIAEILDNDDSKLMKHAVECVASKKVMSEGWSDEPYRIPNVNGLDRPLMAWEIEEIMLEDRNELF